MDKIFTESGYCFDFTNSLNSYKADFVQYHDLSAVDFVVETENNVFFIEVKNPDDKHSTIKNRKEFFNDLQNDLYPYKASAKFTNMLLRKWVTGDFYHKPIIFVFILEYKELSCVIRRKLKDKIFNRLPFSLNKQEFEGKERFEKFELLSIEEFIKLYPEFTIKEIAQ